MRLFAALLFSPAYREKIAAYQRQAALTLPGRYGREDNLHLTLAFIGEQPSADAACRALEAVRVPFSSLVLEAARAELFGDVFVLRMKDAGAQDGGESGNGMAVLRTEGVGPVSILAREVRQALRDGGVPFDPKPMKPHVTVARRVRGPLPAVPVPRGTDTVRACALMQSVRTEKEGLCYLCLREFPLIQNPF